MSKPKSKARKKADKADPRVELANYVCQMIWNRHNCDMSPSMLNSAWKAWQKMDAVTRNFYEVIHPDRCPLLSMVSYEANDADDFDMTEEEFNKAKLDTIEICKDFYN